MSKKHIHPVAILSLLCATASVSNADLIAYWPFDEAEGTVAHDIVGGYDGQISGGSWMTPGKMGAAAYEATGGNEINCGPGPSPTTEDLTLAWWMIDNHESYGTIMDKSVTGSGYGYNILVRNEGSEDSPLRFRIGGWQSYGGWGAECRLPRGAYRDGEWVHIVCTYDSATDTASIYVNGELPENGIYNPKTGIAGPGGYCQGVNNVDTPLYIRGGEETFNGVLDEVAIWDEALSAEDVMKVFRLGPMGLSADDSLSLEIRSSGTDLTFGWESKAGMLYNLRSSTDLAADLSTWDLVEVDGGFDIASTPPVNLHSIPRPGDPVRFYQLEEFPKPPETIFSDDFESGTGDWTTGSDGVAGTVWELGQPANVGPSGSYSPLNCFGTNIAADYDLSANVWLRSPAIDLSFAASATLGYWEFKDIEEGFDFGSVTVLDAADDSPLAVIEAVVDGITPDWEEITLAIPAEALGKTIKLEFRFESDDISSFAGWYIDDVVVTGTVAEVQ